jgi:hypothetical protein
MGIRNRFGYLMGIAASAALLATAANAGTVYSNNFSSNDNGFSGASTLTTSPSGNQFVYFGGAGGSGTLTLTGLTPGSTVTLSFDLYAVGSMDGGGTGGAPIYGGGSGDYFTVNDGATQIFNQAFANYGGGENQTYPVNPSAPGTGAYALNGLGYSGFPAQAGIQDAEYAINLGPFTASSGNVAFTFYDNSNEGASNEFYGIDNVTVTSSGAASGTPEPATWATMLLGLIAIGATVRSHRKLATVTA